MFSWKNVEKQNTHKQQLFVAHWKLRFRIKCDFENAQIKKNDYFSYAYERK